jgi:hypothetical protein
MRDFGNTKGDTGTDTKSGDGGDDGLNTGQIVGIVAGVVAAAAVAGGAAYTVNKRRRAGGAGEDNEVDENAGIALPNLINAVSIPSSELGSEFLE